MIQTDCENYCCPYLIDTVDENNFCELDYDSERECLILYGIRGGK